MVSLVMAGIAFLLFAHGWVHFVYAASSRGWIDGGGWRWSGESRLLGSYVSRKRVNNAAAVLFLLVALGFAAGALAYVLAWRWGRVVLAGSAVGSTLTYALLWDGELDGLPEKGGVGVLINLVVLAWLYSPR